MLNVLRKPATRKPATRIGFAFLLLLMWAAVAPESARASGELVIDDFVSGIQTTGPNCHSVGYSSHSNASILGGKRQLIVIEGHSCTTGNSPRASVDANTGTAEWYGKSAGNSAVFQAFAYGTAIGNISKPWAINPEIANNPQTPMNLSLTTADAIILDMARVDPETGFVRIELVAGDGQRFAAFFTITAGLNSLLLSDFSGLTDAVAADIDGIEFSGQAGGTSVALGNGHIFNKIAIGATAPPDTTPPTVTCSVTPDNLWPPNHKMRAVSVSISVNDTESGPAGFTLVSVTSNELDNGLGDGDTANDIQEFAVGTADTSGQLRAERSGIGTGRVYTLTYTGYDVAGNSAPCSVTVSVPHDRR